MKNIHVLPTDKPSRLYTLNSSKKLYYTNNNLNQIKFTVNQNIYITSSEEIKEGDYYITPNNTVLKALGSMLINTEDYKKIILTTDGDLIKDGVQAIDDEFLQWFVKNPSCEEVEIADLWKEGTPSAHDSYQIIISKEKPKQKTTPEEVAEYLGFVKGVEWQMERSHSDKEVLELLLKMNEWPTTFNSEEEVKEWFEQFKNKLYNITK